MFYVIILHILAVLFQVVVVCNSYQLYKLIKPLKAWSLAWGLFGLSMVIVGLRRGVGVIIWLVDTSFLTSPCPANLIRERLGEGFLLLVISGLWIYFVFAMKGIFDKYLGTHSSVDASTITGRVVNGD